MAFTSTKAGDESDKHQLHDALEVMRANVADPQRVYSCLVRMFDTLVASADGPSQTRAELLVNAVLAPAGTIKFLQELMALHMSQEEIQWYLCCFLTLACRHSLRFQCQAGQLGLWSDVFQARSTHPGSMRVLETSLQTYEALLSGNELQVLKARPAQKLIQEMLATIDRFAYTKSSTTGSKSRSCEVFHPEMVIGALRVLTMIYSSPRLQTLVDEKNAQFAEAITSRLIATFSPIFLDGEFDDVKLWLRMCRLQIQQHHTKAIPGFFLSSSLESQNQGREQLPYFDASRDGKLSKPWFVLLLEKWSDSPTIVYDFLAILTHVFAVPHELDEHLEALAHELLEKHKLLLTMCELLARYHDTLTQGEQQTLSIGEYHLSLTVLEIIRVLRQWSAIETTRKSFAPCSQAKSLLVPTLITQLYTSCKQIHANSSSSKRQQALQMTLEIVILLQKLSQVSDSFRFVLSSSKTLQASVRELKKDHIVSVSPSSSTATAYDKASKSDTDLDSLVKQEVAKLSHLLVVPAADPRQSSTAKTPMKKITSSQQQQPSTRLLFTKPVLSPTRVSTRQLASSSSSSSSAAAFALRSSCSSTKL